MTNKEKSIRLVDHTAEVMTQLWTGSGDDQGIFPITTDVLRELYQYKYERAEADPQYGSDPTPMFDKYGAFMPDNWASGQSLIRDFFKYYPIPDKAIDITELDLYYELMLIQYTLHNDQHYVQITLLADVDGSESCDHYLVTWYKSRGRTERIYRNGKPIRIGEYADLCNIFFAAIKNNGGITDKLN